MPRRAEWTRRLDRILADLDGWPSATLDRAALQTLLGVSPRQALRILHGLSGHRAGHALLIGREELREKLTALAEGGEALLEQTRHRNAVAEIARLSERRRATQVTIAAPSATPPGAIILTPGRLEIRFQSVEELLTRLLELAQSIATDPSLIERTQPTPETL